MKLISKQVSVFGVPGFEVIGYDDWLNQCQYEFENNILKTAFLSWAECNHRYT